MSLLGNVAGFIGTRAPSLFNPASIGRSIGQQAGQTLGQRFGGAEGAQRGSEIGGHIGSIASGITRGENMQNIAKQSLSPIAPFIGSQLGQYLGNRFGGTQGGSIGNQLGAQLGQGASSMINGGDPMQVARQTAYNMLPGIGQALSGNVMQAPQVATISQPQQGYAHGGHVEPHYAMGGYNPGVNPMEIYNRMAMNRMQAMPMPTPYQGGYAHGGYAHDGGYHSRMPSLREVADMMGM